MTPRTGKSSQYRYYTCSTKARQGKSGCSGLNRIIRSHFICTNCGSENVFMLGVSPGDFQGDGLTLVLPKWKLSFSNLFVTELAAAALL